MLSDTLPILFIIFSFTSIFYFPEMVLLWWWIYSTPSKAREIYQKQYFCWSPNSDPSARDPIHSNRRIWFTYRSNSKQIELRSNSSPALRLKLDRVQHDLKSYERTSEIGSLRDKFKQYLLWTALSICVTFCEWRLLWLKNLLLSVSVIRDIQF